MFEKMGIPGCLEIARVTKDKVDAFRPHIPLVIALRNPGMRERHWDALSDVLGFKLKPDDTFTLRNAFDLRL